MTQVPPRYLPVLWRFGAPGLALGQGLRILPPLVACGCSPPSSTCPFGAASNTASKGAPWPWWLEEGGSRPALWLPQVPGQPPSLTPDWSSHDSASAQEWAASGWGFSRLCREHWRKPRWLAGWRCQWVLSPHGGGPGLAGAGPGPGHRWKWLVLSWRAEPRGWGRRQQQDAAHWLIPESLHAGPLFQSGLQEPQAPDVGFCLSPRCRNQVPLLGHREAER